MRVGILTSVETRHQYFVRALCAQVEVAAVGVEQTGYSPATILPADLSEEETRIVNEHFAERGRQELEYFGAETREGRWKSAIPNQVLHIQPRCLNTIETLKSLECAAVDTLVIYGTNLIKEPILNRYAGRMLNMHLGLSPYYRGTATNFYPLFNGEPQYVGATIHLIDSGIDSGPIFKQARPSIVSDDQPHTIGCKAILAGIDAMIAVLKDLAAGRAQSVPQWKAPNARLYLRRDYHPRQVVELYKKLNAGLIPEYVRRALHDPPQVRLVT